MKTERKINPNISLSIFTTIEPIFLLAASKESAVTVQNIAVKRAAKCPE